MRLAGKASNSKDLKIINRISVLNIIRKNAPVARHEVAKMTGLTPAAVTVIVNELIETGVIREVGHGESSGGRRPVMLEVNASTGYIFVARIQQGEIVTALLDLAGNILENQKQKIETTRSEEIVATIGRVFDTVIVKFRIPREKVLWCGVASPGLVNSYIGTVERSANLNWRQVNFAEMLSQRLSGVPVNVENISNAAALGEKFYGSGYGCANLIYLNLSVGIGAGIIINHELFSGVRGYAGEIDLIAVSTFSDDQNTSKVQCHKFKELCGVGAIIKKVKAIIPVATFSQMGLSKNQIGIEEILLPPLIELPEVRMIILEASRLIGIKVAELINLFNTEMVVLGGELTWAGDLLLDSVINMVKEHTYPEMTESVKILITSMKEDPPLMGVYALVYEKLFNSGKLICSAIPFISHNK